MAKIKTLSDEFRKHSSHPLKSFGIDSNNEKALGVISDEVNDLNFLKIKEGKIKQIIGAVVDVEFAFGNLPKILDRLECKVEGKAITLEVAEYLNEKSVRTIASRATNKFVTELSEVKVSSKNIGHSPKILLLVVELSEVKVAPKNIEHFPEILLNNSFNIKKQKLPQHQPKPDNKLHHPKHEYRPYAKSGPCHANNYR